MNWEILNSEQQFQKLLAETPLFAVFKHSTRCSISSMAKNRLERDWDLEFSLYYLDLIAFRSLSNLVAQQSGVEHQSPQLIVFQQGKAVYDASHTSIAVDDLKEELVN